MPMMSSIEVPAARVAVIRKMIPAGIEHSVTPRNGFTHINLRTNDHSLIRRIMENRGSPVDA